MRTVILLWAIALSTSVKAQLKTPTLSPLATVKQSVGVTDISISYFRPSVRGRKIFGANGLLLNGDVWRTGANGATKITFTNPVMVNGQRVEKGSYTLLSIIGEKEWLINWFPYEESNWTAYADKEPILHLKLPINKASSFVETLEFRFQNVTLNSVTLVLEWENTSLQIPIELDEKEIILKSIKTALAGPNSFDYYQAALYLHESQIDLNTALTYIKRVTASDQALFFQVTREALILQDLGKKEEALISARRALELSKKAGNKDFIRINNGLIKKNQF